MRPLEPASLLALAALLGATAVGLTLVVRRAPVVSRWVHAGLKPFACNLCCATWSTLALTVAAAAITREPWAAAAWLPALAIATWGLHLAEPPALPDLALPALEETDGQAPEHRGDAHELEREETAPAIEAEP